ncbi:hypothetical protein [Pseudoalteromonas luteoviolacea]|uniref:Uncharacterized protein n=1 Tax=Pseudoalteromonas luteoviolacea S4060-1 TaxID=1365257 RepID=A0A161YNK8_9GAMM|nr:hypothetical protein [Pseudoalteromonas luteoviolacea]KZN63399.1 hypothetical protein N478_03860 [Pseudoalteromonas luteoviolacea S4060-1]
MLDKLKSFGFKALIFFGSFSVIFLAIYTLAPIFPSAFEALKSSSLAINYFKYLILLIAWLYWPQLVNYFIHERERADFLISQRSLFYSIVIGLEVITWTTRML